MHNYRPKLIENAFVDFISERLSPFHSPISPKLQLLKRYPLTDNLVALQLRPNQVWQRRVSKLSPRLGSISGSKLVSEPWQSGQHITLGVMLGSICHHRSYSLVGTPTLSVLAPATFEQLDHHSQSSSSHIETLTIAIKPQGKVSNYLAHQAKIGEVFDCSLPQGDFTLTHYAVDKHQPLGFIASGSGITPMPGLVATALQSGVANRAVTLLYYHRQPAFLEFWHYLSDHFDNFHCHLINTNDPDSYIDDSRYVSSGVLKAINLDAAQCHLFACGSASLLSGVAEALKQLNPHKIPTSDDGQVSPFAIDNLAIENFEQILAPSEEVNNTDDLGDDESTQASGPPLNIQFRRRGRKLPVLSPSQSILQCAEAGQIRLPHGCRQGICNTCRCDKISGVVKDRVTGKVTHGGQESIKPCISIPLTDVVLDA